MKMQIEGIDGHKDIDWCTQVESRSRAYGSMRAFQM